MDGDRRIRISIPSVVHSVTSLKMECPSHASLPALASGHHQLMSAFAVKGASLEDGLLQVELQLEMPEAMRPRRIDIKTGKSVGQGDKVRTIEGSKVA